MTEEIVQLQRPATTGTQTEGATEALTFTELSCCGVPYGYLDQHGREYDLEKNLKPDNEQTGGRGSDQYYAGEIAGQNPNAE